MEKSHPYPGKFIIFEGVEGSGKSTQAKLLSEKLREQGRAVTLTKEPGGTEMGDKIREILLYKDNVDLVPLAELFLFLAGRAQHISEVIEPNLAKGGVVISDRFSPSTIAYQIYGRNLEKYTHQITLADSWARNNISPDLIILLDLDPGAGLSRIQRDKTRFEEEAMAFHERVRRGFLDQANNDSEHWFLVNGEVSAEEISEKIWERVKKIL